MGSTFTLPARDQDLVDISEQGIEQLDAAILQRHQAQQLTVRRLHARRNRIRDLPAELEACTQLYEISLRENQIQVFPAVLCRMTGLVKLSLGSNRLTSVPEGIGKLTQLQILALPGNQLTTLPESIGNLRKLQSLDLQQNRLERLPDALCDLESLRELLLQRNQRLTRLPDAFAGSKDTIGLQQLRILHLGTNQFRQVPASILRLPLLEELHMPENQIPELPPDMFEALPHLRVLEVFANALKEIPVEIRHAQSLRRLNVAINQLAELPREIGHLQQLEWLNLNGNRLEYLPASMGSMKSCKKLGLVQNRLRALPDELASMQSLAKMDVRKNLLNAFPPALRHMHQLTILVAENPLCTKMGRQQGGHQGPHSLLELCLRNLWTSRALSWIIGAKETLSGNSHESVKEIGGGSFASHHDLQSLSQEVDNDTLPAKVTDAISTTASTTPASTVLPRHLERLLQKPKICHICLIPYRKESITVMDEGALASGGNTNTTPAPTMVPYQYVVCSDRCALQLEGKLPFDAQRICTSAWMTANEFHRGEKLHDVSAAIVFADDTKLTHQLLSAFHSKLASPVDNFPYGPGSVTGTAVENFPPRLPLDWNGKGYAWYALVAGQALPSQQPTETSTSSSSSLQPSQDAEYRLLERLREILLRPSRGNATADALDEPREPREQDLF